MTHTPGPWNVQGGKGRKGELYVWMQGTYMSGHAIATVHDNVPESAAANAALIAAAPMMEEALHGIAALACQHDPTTGFYKPVDPYALQSILTYVTPTIHGYCTDAESVSKLRAAIAKAKGESK